MPRANPEQAPEHANATENSEQRDEDQAQQVADDARDRATDPTEDSEHGGKPDPAAIIPDDTPDLVDKMTEMNRSGVIDNHAYDGEPQHDDEEDIRGPTENAGNTP